MKVWTTKYAFTKGIQEMSVHAGGMRRDGTDTEYVYSDHTYPIQFRLGKTAFRTRDEAVKNAELRRQARIRLARKSLAKLEAMKHAYPVDTQ